jgi:galactonate dehydratase
LAFFLRVLGILAFALSGFTMTTRRELLTTTAAIAAGAALLQEVRGADNPAQQVEDRGSKIKITALRTFRTGSGIYIKIETDAGISGWGDCPILAPAVTSTLAHSLFELLDGQNPTRIEYLWNRLYRSHRDMRGGPCMCHVIGAIDQALWDITGKAWGVPVYRLLGGPMRDKMRVYPTETAIKCGTTGGPIPHSGTPKELHDIADGIKATRQRLGPAGTIMFDCHSALPPAYVIQLASMVEPYDVLWFEEPAVPNSIEVFKRIKQQVKIPLATGERDLTLWGFLPYLHERCIDILQPDVAETGGITQFKKIATLAEAYSVPLAPHNCTGALGTTASLHASASVAELLIVEAYPDNSGVARKNWEVDKEGYASLPQGPGLGVEVDESKLKPVDPNEKYRWPVFTAADGSVRDY